MIGMNATTGCTAHALIKRDATCGFATAAVSAVRDGRVKTLMIIIITIIGFVLLYRAIMS